MNLKHLIFIRRTFVYNVFVFFKCEVIFMYSNTDMVTLKTQDSDFRLRIAIAILTR